jgi:hypothetical protein
MLPWYTVRGNCGALHFIPELILPKVTFNLIVSLLYVFSVTTINRIWISLSGQCSHWDTAPATRRSRGERGCFASPSYTLPGFLRCRSQKGPDSSPIFSRESPRTVQYLLDVLAAGYMGRHARREPLESRVKILASDAQPAARRTDRCGLRVKFANKKLKIMGLI